MTDIIDDLTQETLKKIIFNVVVKLVMQKLIQMLPFLGLSFVSPFVSFLVTKLLTVFYDELVKVVKFKIIDIKTDLEREQFDRALTQLREKLLDMESAEEIENARQEVENRARDLITSRI